MLIYYRNYIIDFIYFAIIGVGMVCFSNFATHNISWIMLIIKGLLAVMVAFLTIILRYRHTEEFGYVIGHIKALCQKMQHSLRS